MNVAGVAIWCCYQLSFAALVIFTVDFYLLMNRHPLSRKCKDLKITYIHYAGGVFGLFLSMGAAQLTEHDYVGLPCLAIALYFVFRITALKLLVRPMMIV